MAAAPTFVQQTQPVLYQLSTLAEAGLSGYWAGYIATADSGLGATATTRAVFQNVGGYYLFLGETPSDWDGFLAELAQIRPNLAPLNQLRMLWIENPNDKSFQWRFSALQARASGTGAAIVWTISRALLFRVGDYGLQITGQGGITYIDDTAGAGLAFPAGGLFSGPDGSAPLSTTGFKMSFSGQELGCFEGEFSVSAPENVDDQTIWEMFRIGLQFAKAPEPQMMPVIPPNSQNLFDPKLGYVSATSILFQPIFEGQAQAITCVLCFDNLNSSNGGRTFLGLQPTIDGGAPSLASFYRTTIGYKVALTPLSAAGVIPAARFVFGACPVQGSDPAAGLRYHLSPEGGFQLTVLVPTGQRLDTVANTMPPQLLMGLSGLEYVALTGNNSDQIVFSGGKPGFAPSEEEDSEGLEVSQALTDTATTSHGTILPFSSASKTVFYAQPKEAPIFSGKTQIQEGFLDFNPMPAATLDVTTATWPPVFPIGVYAGLEAGDAFLAKALELSSISPYRHYRISQGYVGGTKAALPMRRERAPDDPLGVTPQGLIAELTPDYLTFDGLLVANMPGTDYPKVEFTAVAGGFKHALQSNQVFFVAANVTELMKGTSVNYELRDDDKAVLLAMGVPQANIDAVYMAISGRTQPFKTELAFTTAIAVAATQTFLPIYLDVAGLMRVEIDGWTFQLSPRSWRGWQMSTTGADEKLSPTIMIAKFCNRSLLDMVGDTSSWAWPEVAIPDMPGASIRSSQQVIMDIFSAAEKEGAGDAYKSFYEKIVINPAWNGFLFLNTPVEISELPTDLQFLTAGLDLSDFYAHHVGFSQTPFVVSGGTPSPEQTAAFGLIDYVDDVDLYAEASVEFDFKTLQLRAEFSNAALSGFSARAEFLVNKLFSDNLTKRHASHGNNLVLDGSYQKVADTPVYSFVLAGENSYATQASILSNIVVSNVRLQTRTGLDAAGDIETDVTLSGVLQFSAPQDFDLYSYGPVFGEDNPVHAAPGLRFDGLVISMKFKLLDSSGEKIFTLRDNSLSFDLANSQVRDQSLVNHFPLTLTSLVSVAAVEEGADDNDQDISASPEDLGFVSVSAPFLQTPLTAPWFGLVFTLDLGTLGALMGSHGISVQLIAAWQAGENQSTEAPPQYLGIKLPDAKAVGINWPLQGVLKLGFRSFQFLRYYDKSNQQVYLLKLHHLALSILGMSFPPGNNDVILFGNPDQTAASKLGWYAAYASDKKATDKVTARSGSKRLADGTAGQGDVNAPVAGLRSPGKIRTSRRAASARRGASSVNKEELGDG